MNYKPQDNQHTTGISKFHVLLVWAKFLPSWATLRKHYADDGTTVQDPAFAAQPILKDNSYCPALEAGQLANTNIHKLCRGIASIKRGGKFRARPLHGWLYTLTLAFANWVFTHSLLTSDFTSFRGHVPSRPSQLQRGPLQPCPSSPLWWLRFGEASKELQLRYPGRKSPQNSAFGWWPNVVLLKSLVLLTLRNHTTEQRLRQCQPSRQSRPTWAHGKLTSHYLQLKRWGWAVKSYSPHGKGPQKHPVFFRIHKCIEFHVRFVSHQHVNQSPFPPAIIIYHPNHEKFI